MMMLQHLRISAVTSIVLETRTIVHPHALAAKLKQNFATYQVLVAYQTKFKKFKPDLKFS